MAELSFAERLRREVERSPDSRSEAGKALEIDPFHDTHLEEKVRDPDAWVVNLDEPFSTLGQKMSSGLGHTGELVLLLGARGSGKTLLLDVLHRLAQDSTELDGTRVDAPELLEEEKEGLQRIERLFPEWRSRRAENTLHYLLVDNVRWSWLLRGRLHQLTRAFGESPPTLVFAMNFFQAWELWSRNRAVYKKAERIHIHPYPRRHLQSLWATYFDEIGLDEDLVHEVIEHSLGNPRLLLRQGLDLTEKSKDQEITIDYLRTYWRNEGYRKALELKTGEHFRFRGSGSPNDSNEMATREKVLIRACEGTRGATATDMARDSGMERSLCSYHLGKLQEEGWLDRDRDGPRVRYIPPAPIRVPVENHLVMGYERD